MEKIARCQKSLGYCVDCGRFFAVKYDIFSELPDGHIWYGEEWEDFFVEVEDAGHVFLLEHDPPEVNKEIAFCKECEKFFPVRHFPIEELPEGHDWDGEPPFQFVEETKNYGYFIKHI